MAAGSYLLYQLLHYDVEKLQVVADVTGNQSFLFDKNTQMVSMYADITKLENFLLAKSLREVKGYVIYDVAKKGRNPSVFFVPSSWGMIVLTSPNEGNFKEWRKHQEAMPIIINCPHRIDVKAMCFWVKHDQRPEEQAEDQARDTVQYWENIEERMDKVAPIPRCILNEEEYNIQQYAIDKAVELIECPNSLKYMDVGSGNLWAADDVSHKIVKVVRVIEVTGVEVGYNAPVSRLAMAKITYRLTHMMPLVDVFNLFLCKSKYLM
ncbi:retrotransposon hot spot (RHS) protein, putative [Trypanosoma cruzi marinkellei]|uniref:Retrotransposon hot spot (RHS) protein, putative n=1 Tax=Trypanosoma cruzi marinkellei TaxID=85056 RepID=K2MR17_TRYCR|nr:retrotransposon hot spot (RHS) protein, putative [Trypanosoma cruzi marinkellei]